MKTYTKTVTLRQPRLVIMHEDSPESPREWSTLGAFLTKDRNYYSPDGRKYPELQEIMERTGEEATSQDDHITRMKTAIAEETSHEVLAIYPVVKYEHGALVYRLGTEKGFDYSNNGFYIVLKKNSDELGTPDGEEAQKHLIADELKTYTQYANGEVFCYKLYDENGELEDSCGGFYSLEEIQDALGEEWKDEKIAEYVQY